MKKIYFIDKKYFISDLLAIKLFIKQTNVQIIRLC